MSIYTPIYPEQSLTTKIDKINEQTIIEAMLKGMRFFN